MMHAMFLKLNDHVIHDDEMTKKERDRAFNISLAPFYWITYEWMEKG